jgi:hypothetical protein
MPVPPYCFNCKAEVDEDAVCFGCGAAVCDECELNMNMPFGGHEKELHLEPNEI